VIVLFVHELNMGPSFRFIRTTKGRIPPIQVCTYQSAFRRLSYPAGTLIFTDFEFLSGFEMMVAAEMAEAALRVDPANKVLNHPARACERYVLLRRLRAEGLNPTEITRLDAGERPTRYPVFLRLEDGAFGPETGLLATAADFDQKLRELALQGLPFKRRVAVSYEGEPDADGLFRKYGAFRIGSSIVPHHLLRSSDWSVKSGRNESDPAFLSEELAYVRDNPHAEHLMQVAKTGGLEFGRIDYGFAQGRPVIFEMNSNPTFPRFRGGSSDREDRRAIILDRLRTALQAIDGSDARRSRIRFTPHPHARRYVQMHRWGPLQVGLWRLRVALRDRSWRLEKH
jgi:hypothetical protein